MSRPAVTPRRRDVLRLLSLGGAGSAALAVPSAGHAAGEPIVLAQVASTTNASAANNSRGMLLGMNALFAQVNARGGVNGRPVSVVNHDDDLNPGRMVEIVSKQLLPDPRVLGFIGFVNTGGLTALAKDEVFGRQGIAMVAPLQGDKAVIDAENVFPFRAGYADEVRALIQHARTMNQQRVAVVAYSIAFGPAMARLAEAAAQEAGMQVSVVMVDGAPDKIEANMASAAAQALASKPDAVLMVCAGRYASELAKALRETAGSGLSLLTMSVVIAEPLVKAIGAEKARGIVIAQAVPFPFSGALPLVLEYQRAMKAAHPAEPLSFASIEGFAAAKIALAGLQRAGANPSRERLAQALLGLGELNLGGVFVNYSRSARLGWRHVELSIVDAAGQLRR
ncbi:ABC transporter substrate-binding protein [Ideonella sp. DXS22W]|uniref:ABC transporter substrate-binding protein n=1 Tax=Pseudaquabacterium inlustre TaxID=2984192 RepID=A0ABU9CDK6_9BURK